MSVLTSVGILVFIALIMALLQFVPGVLMIFAHFANGKYARHKASELATFFILGVETVVVLIFLSVFFILSSSPAIIYAVNSDIFAWIMAGILVALSGIFVGCYFRKGKGTELFVSRRLAGQYLDKAKNARTQSDAFLLGFISVIPELVFTLPLYILATIEIMQIGTDSLSRAGLIIILALAVIAPLLIMQGFLAAHHTLADLTRFRFKHKAFFRLTIALLYLLLAALIMLRILL